MKAVVFALDASGACIATTALFVMRDLLRFATSPGLKRAWQTLIVVVVCCTGLLVASSAAAAGRELHAHDLTTAALHVLGPSFVLGVSWLSRRTMRDVARMPDLERSTFLDPLTELANRRRFDQQLAAQVAHATASDEPLSLVVLDVDRFKCVNDTYGHCNGDLVLKKLASMMLASWRASDTVCRIGGEEFAVISPGLHIGLAQARAEELRQMVARTPIPLGDGRPILTTVSLGLAALRPDEAPDAFLRRADAALYLSKGAGRDRISTAA